MFIRMQQNEEEDPRTSYTNAIYFIFMTASTVGYGDSDIGIEILSHQILQTQYMVVILYVFLLQIFYSFLQMTLRFMFNEWHRIYNNEEVNHENLTDWFARRNRVKSLRSAFEKKISHFFKFIEIWDVENTIKSHFFTQLHEKAKTEVSDYIGMKIAHKFRFFDDFSEVNKADLAFSSKVIKYTELN